MDKEIEDLRKLLEKYNQVTLICITHLGNEINENHDDDCEHSVKAQNTLNLIKSILEG